MAKCNGCGREIIWIKTPGGKNHPLNAQPEKRWVKMPDSEDNDWKGGYSMEDTYTSHFSDCPNAKEFRKTETASRSFESPTAGFYKKGPMRNG